LHGLAINNLDGKAEHFEIRKEAFAPFFGYLIDDVINKAEGYFLFIF
jgi:hypothetical protein